MNRFGSIIKVTVLAVALLVPKLAVADEMNQRIIALFVQAHCVKCHGPTRQSGDFRIDNLTAGPKDVEQWQAVRQQLRSGLMPPSKEAKPDPKKVQDVIVWIEAELT